jgi:hypothetical protein
MYVYKDAEVSLNGTGLFIELFIPLGRVEMHEIFRSSVVAIQWLGGDPNDVLSVRKMQFHNLAVGA